MPKTSRRSSGSRHERAQRATKRAQGECRHPRNEGIGMSSPLDTKAAEQASPATREALPTGSLIGDGLTVAKRNLIKIRRVPDLLIFTTLQPIMFVLLFGYVFGSLAGSGASVQAGYREF